MSILWNVFSALIGGLIGSVVGARMTRSSMLELQEREFRQRGYQALRALLVELEGNENLVFNMISKSDISLRSRLRRSIWDSQLPIIAWRLEPAQLGIIDRAYYNVDYLMRDVPTMGHPPTMALSATLQFLKEAAAMVRHAAGLPELPKN